jgi:two-component system response regulator FixJ
MGAMPTNTSAMSTRSALVIDDDDSFRMALCDLLEQRGLSVRTAKDAAEASRELEAGRFEVVFTDIRMPGGGFAVLDEVRAKGTRVPVIFITGSSSLEWKARAEAKGAFAYLTKPVGKEQILTVLRLAFERGRSPAELHAAPAPEKSREPMRAGGVG